MQLWKKFLMDDGDKTKQQLIHELNELRQQIAGVGDALRASEERYRLVVRGANDGVWDWNLATDEGYFSPRYMEIMGYEPREFPHNGEEWRKRIHPDDLEHALAANQRCIDGEVDLFTAEYRMHHKDGSWRWILGRGANLKNETGKIYRMAGTHTDITERKQAETILRQYMMEQNILLNVSQSVSSTLNLETVLQTISDGAAELLDIDCAAIYLLEKEELFLGATTPPLDPQMPESLRRALLTDHSHILEAVLTRLPVILPDTKLAKLSPAEKDIVDIRQLHSMIYLPLQQEGHVIGILILGTVGQPRRFSDHEIDLCRNMSNHLSLGIQNASLHTELTQHAKELEAQITERKQAEAALGESEAHFRKLFEGIDDAVFVHDKESNILAVNEATCRRLGYSRDELLQMKTTDIDAPDYAAGFEERLKQQLATGGMSGIGGVHITNDGRQIFVDVNTKIINYQGQAAVLAVCRDITERKRAEKEHLQLALERERVQLLANFITKTSHEFKTPLAIINTSAYMLSKLDDPDDRQRHADKIEDHVNDIVMLIDALTLMSKLDTIQELPLAKLDLNAVVSVVYENRQVDFEAIRHKLVLDLSDSPLLRQSHYGYLVMAVEKILDNAIRYSPTAGTITMLTRIVDDHAMIEITDTGAGISDEQLPHIFERFYRADVAATTRGLGLGLPIVKSIIEHHNGRIEVESEVGKGSTFRVILPLE
jgi:PAS domain S-box-containing protein